MLRNVRSRADHPTSLVLGAFLCLAGCQAPEVDYAGGGAAIRNGTPQPQVLPLPPEQQLAIGWIADVATPETSFCTGTLVGTRAVATARHCVEGREPEALRFGVGREPTEPRAIFPVVEAHLHPAEDAALLVLATDATRRLPGLRPIPANEANLDGEAGAALVGTRVDVAGYGATQDPQRTGRWFAAVEVDRVTPKYIVVNGRGEQGLCFGDSGGPVIVSGATGEPVVAGVEHAGEMSCVGTDQLTRLDPIQDWLREVAAPALAQPCGAIDYLGRCAGEVAEWCDGDVLARADCTLTDEVCGYVNDESGFYCAPKSTFPERAPEVARFVGGCESTPGPTPGWLLLLLGALLHRRHQPLDVDPVVGPGRR